MNEMLIGATGSPEMAQSELMSPIWNSEWRNW